MTRSSAPQQTFVRTVIAGAGGLVTDWRGDPVGAHGGQVAIAGDRDLLEAALVALRPAARAAA